MEMELSEILVWFCKNITERPYWFIIDKSNGLVIDGSCVGEDKTSEQKQAEFIRTMTLLKYNFGVYQIDLHQNYYENHASRKRSLTVSIPYFKTK